MVASAKAINQKKRGSKSVRRTKSYNGRNAHLDRGLVVARTRARPKPAHGPSNMAFHYWRTLATAAETDRVS